MKIKNLKEEIKGLDEKPAGIVLMNIQALIDLFKDEIGRGSSFDKILEYFESVKEKEKHTTYFDVYRDSIFSFDRKETKSNIFAEAIMLAEKLKKGENFLIKELTIIQERIPKSAYSNLVKARAIVNIEIPEEEKKKEEENKTKEK